MATRPPRGRERTGDQRGSAPGFRPKQRTREIVCDAEAWPALAPDDGCEALRATVVTNLTFEQLAEIPASVRYHAETEQYIVSCDDTTRTAIAPYVVDWNCEAIDLVTGKAMPVPPPAEIGADAFRAVDWQVAAWLAATLKTIHRTDPALLEKKEPTESTPATASG
jgi:hypothetical protein